MKPMVSIGRAADRLGLSVDTVRELERAGDLQAVRTAGGHRRFAVAALDAWLARHSAPGARRRAPATPSARRRDRAEKLQEGPGDEEWGDPEPTRRARPATPAPKTLQEQLLEGLKQATEEREERSRIANLKSYGQSLIPYDATAAARSSVIEELDSYVTARRFPPSTDTWDARRAIEPRVEALLEPYKEAAARKAAERAEDEARAAAEEQDEQRLQLLIEHGKSRAFLATTRWESEDRDEARAEVEEALEDEVESDWSEQDVEDLVDEILDEWEEEDA